MLIADAHLDLAYNHVRRGRDVTRPAAEQPAVESGESATCGLPDLRAGGVGLVCATVFCEPKSAEHDGYADEHEAHAQALAQLDCYDDLARRGELVAWDGDPASLRRGALPKRVTLLEGADAIRTPADVALFAARGVRIVGLAWHATRHSAGTGAPGGLTDLGRATVAELDRHGVVHDLSHLAERACDELLDLAAGKIIASHSNARALIGDDPKGRHLPDHILKRAFARGATVGVVLYDKFLVPSAEQPRRATLADVVAQVRHLCDVAGNATQVGLGTDFDGGVGRDDIPVELRTSADLPKVADALSAAGLDDAAVRGVMGANWVRALATA